MSQETCSDMILMEIRMLLMRN